MTDILSVRDHSKPCEHTVAFFKERDEELPTEWLHLQAGYGWCEDCPGGREIKLRRPKPKAGGFWGRILKEAVADVWVEVAE